jgi:hypothetical protein
MWVSCTFHAPAPVVSEYSSGSRRPTHLLPDPQAVVLLELALVVRNAVLAHNPAADCQCRAHSAAVAGATYPAIVKSGEVYSRGLRGQLVVSWVGRLWFVELHVHVE